MTIELRDYQERDAPVLAELYYQTIHRVNKADYSLGRPLKLNRHQHGSLDFARIRPLWRHCIIVWWALRNL
jgi:hypothetical protein